MRTSVFLIWYSFFRYILWKGWWVWLFVDLFQICWCIDLNLTNAPDLLFDTKAWLPSRDLYNFFKSSFVKLEPKVVKYKSYKDFSPEIYFSELSFNLNNICSGNFSTSSSIFRSLLGRHAPIKTCYKRGTHKPHITKELCKALMKVPK